jgi:acyl carrier protein
MRNKKKIGGMKMSNMVEEIKKMVIEILEVEPEEINMETDFIKDLKVDSLRSLEILATLEKKYRIKIPEEMLKKMTNLKQVIEITEQMTAAKV